VQVCCQWAYENHAPFPRFFSRPIVSSNSLSLIKSSSDGTKADINSLFPKVTLVFKAVEQKQGLVFTPRGDYRRISMAPKKKGPLKGPKGGGRKGKPAPPKKKNKSLSGQGES
jgi:hypothetical protein